MDDVCSDRESIYWLALLRLPGAGSLICKRLLDDFGDPETIFQQDVAGLAGYGLRPKTKQFLQNPPWSKIEEDLKWLDRPENRLITIHDPSYPLLLKQIPDPPVALYLRGGPDILGNLQISMVGSRGASPDGRRQARDFAKQLAGLGLTITSGLALGVDSYSHLGALDAGGTTIAVLGSGLDYIYPMKNKDLAGSIINHGALVSEFPPDFRPNPGYFPRRNRIISGLSLGTLVVEAGIRSGSLITARLALEQGREVFAIPGSIYNPLTRGCHALIRQGAKLVEHVNDILEEIGPLATLAVQQLVGQRSEMGENRQNCTKGLDEQGKLLLDNIGKWPVSIDYLVEETGLTVSIISTLLLDLELRGLVESLPGGEYKRI